MAHQLIQGVTEERQLLFYFCAQNAPKGAVICVQDLHGVPQGFGEVVRVPLGHGCGFMLEEDLHFVDVLLVLHQAGPERVPEVMKPEVLDLRPLRGIEGDIL